MQKRADPNRERCVSVDYRRECDKGVRKHTLLPKTVRAGKNRVLVDRSSAARIRILSAPDGKMRAESISCERVALMKNSLTLTPFLILTSIAPQLAVLSTPKY